MLLVFTKEKVLLHSRHIDSTEFNYYFADSKNKPSQITTKDNKLNQKCTSHDTQNIDKKSNYKNTYFGIPLSK